MRNASPSLVWFRRDLRVTDNPALAAAIEKSATDGGAVIAAYVLDDSRHFSPGAAQRWFIHHALAALRETLEAAGVALLLRKGPEEKTILELATEFGVGAVFWNRRYAAEEMAIDEAVKKALKARGVCASSSNGSLLREPWEIATQTGGPYRVFTPFWKALKAAGPSMRTTPTPKKRGRAAARCPDDLATLRLLPVNPDWASEFGAHWTASEQGAARALDRFLEGPATNYADDRDRPDRAGTSRLSPHLAVGTISPIRIWNAAMHASDSGAVPESQAFKFLSELAWREFAYHLLFHFPSLPDAPLRPAFSAFPWRDDERSFRAWTRSQTGIPIIDAGMSELWRTGWMHNRVRMIVASFLVKNLLIDWRRGERWFWDTLVDADPANNPAGWQWVAGSGADAAPYFRIFNPLTQGEKFDPDGAYIRAYAPSPRAKPIVDLGATRRRALGAYDAMKKSAGLSEAVGGVE